MMTQNLLIDSHAHLDFDAFENELDAIIERAAEAGVEKVVTIGCSVDSSKRSLEIAEKYENLSCTAGIHPHEAGNFDDATWPELETLWKNELVVGVGETGLDYYYDFSPHDRQRELFKRHLEAARDHHLPIVIHVRDAFDDAFALIASVELSAGGILHCFTGGPKECERALELGLHISLSGIATFPKATQIHEAIPLIPLDRLLVETDSPYLAPVPYRGKRNEPAYVVYTAKYIADKRGMTFDALAQATYENTVRLFGLDRRGV